MEILYGLLIIRLNYCDYRCCKRERFISVVILNVVLALMSYLNSATHYIDVFDINKLQSANFMYNVYYGLMPASISEIFSTVNSVHHYNTRNQCSFYHNSATYNARNMFIAILGPVVWDNVPITLKSCPSLVKTRFKRFLIKTRISK